ncbi:hypothetical protein EXIGLDRAFT_751408 [Exidia glandulosa HHB12029]|uniref:PEP-CTERM sorting domain-containing protein n=1 Tax=Exidia glandulosa HHB12029 TaxID=1314781 RepID=A0A165FFN1_EXIGL|nr:hypothetical protein EXIGLDRAFT_751408 [Exidia glandulosa HHB12029]
MRTSVSTSISLLVAASLASAQNVLFVGNSYTHGNISPTVTYNAGNITDANGTGYGGVPGIFKQLTDSVGLDFAVTIEAVGGKTLQYHLENKASIIGQANWDIVVFQEFSYAPVPESRMGDPSLFQNAAKDLISLVRSKNSAVKVYLYETWARADLVYPDGTPYHNASVKVFTTDLRTSYANVGAQNSVAGVVPVGDNFLKAINHGVADRNPYDGIDAGKVNIWAPDSHHPSVYGSYLSAATFFQHITGKPAKSLAVGPGTAAAGLGISCADATRLLKLV